MDILFCLKNYIVQFLFLTFCFSMTKYKIRQSLVFLTFSPRLWFHLLYFPNFCCSRHSWLLHPLSYYIFLILNYKYIIYNILLFPKKGMYPGELIPEGAYNRRDFHVTNLLDLYLGGWITKISQKINSCFTIH